VAHFVRVEGVTTGEVIVISDEVCPDPAPDNEHFGQAYIRDVLGLPGTWLQTSYNNSFRGVYASGAVYDPELDEFVHHVPLGEPPVE
jgi:hypothetical protein